MPFGHLKQHPRRTSRLTTALFPVPKRFHAYPYHCGKLILGKRKSGPNQFYIGTLDRICAGRFLLQPQYCAALTHTRDQFFELRLFHGYSSSIIVRNISTCAFVKSVRSLFAYMNNMRI